MLRINVIFPQAWLRTLMYSLIQHTEKIYLPGKITEAYPSTKQHKPGCTHTDGWTDGRTDISTLHQFGNQQFIDSKRQLYWLLHGVLFFLSTEQRFLYRLHTYLFMWKCCNITAEEEGDDACNRPSDTFSFGKVQPVYAHPHTHTRTDERTDSGWARIKSRMCCHKSLYWLANAALFFATLCKPHSGEAKSPTRHQRQSYPGARGGRLGYSCRPKGEKKW